jgi:nitrogen fixation protein FixH
VAIQSPEAGQRLSKQQSMKWQAQDPDKDPLRFRVEVSPDLGASWQEVTRDLREPKCDWDTTKQKDGQYLLRVTASDGLSEPDEPLTANAAEVVWVDNTAPAVLLFKSSLAVDEQRRATVSGMASDQLSPIQSVEYRVDEGEWRSAPLGSVESSLAAVSVVTEPLAVGKHKLAIQAFDAAGNIASDSTDVEVPALSAVEGKEPKAEARPPEAAPAPPAPGEKAAPEEPKAGSAPPQPSESAPAAPAPQP